MATKEKGRRTYGTGSIFQRKDGRWVAAERDPQGKTIQRYAKTEREAKLRLKQLQAELARGEARAGTSLKLGDWVDQWLTTVEQRGRADSTLRHRRQHLRDYIVPTIGRIPLSKLTVAQAQRWVDGLAGRGLKASSVRQIVHTLSAALSAAERQELVGRNVTRLIELPQLPKDTTVVPLTQEEVDRLLAVVQGDKHEALVLTMLHLGLRGGELAGLRWEDIDFQERVAHIRVQAQYENRQWVLKELKTRNGRRTVPISPTALEALRAQRAQVLEDRLRTGTAAQWNLVFPSPHGTPYHRVTLKLWLKRRFQTSGIPIRRMHDFRHTAASMWLAEGVPLETVSKILGHSGVAITANVYGHLYDRQRRAVAEASERAFGRKKAQ